MFTRGFLLFILVAGIVLSGCTRKRSSSQNGYPFSEISGKVRYEHATADGELVGRSIIRDPFLDLYDRGVWVSSNDRKVTTLGQPSAKNRVHMVFVGDGYVETEMKKYADDVDTNLAALLDQEPFKSYRNYFSFHRVDVISDESGITEEVPGQERETALQMTYNCAGIERLLCANLNRVMEEAQNAPKVHAVFAIANSEKYGGAGYMSPAVSTFAARNVSSLEIAIHEFGHSFADLGDEYDYGSTSSSCPKYANVSTQPEETILEKKIKWFRWLDLPHIGTFLGSCYSKDDYYRPTDRSKMRVLGRPFEEVNTEQLILKIYERVRPIEFATKSGFYNGHRKFEVFPMQPNTHSLKIEWYVNGQILAQRRNQKGLDTQTLNLPSGKKHRIKAVVTDPTSQVRDEGARKKRMSQSVEWSIEI